MIGKALTINTTLAELSMRSNHLSERGAIALISAMNSRQSLMTYDA